MPELYPGIYQVTLTLKGFSPGSVNLYLLRNQSGLAIIDTGWDLPTAVESLQDQLRGMGWKYSDINTVLITHCHSDHLGMVNRLKRENQAAVYLQRHEMELINMRYTTRNDYWQKTDEYLYRHGLPPAEMPALGYPLPQITELVPPDVWLDGGETIRVGDFVLQVINTPGHSPGHVAYYEPRLKLLFSGDTVLPTIATNAATHIQIMTNPLQQYLDSLQTLLEMDIAMVLPGHQYPFSDYRGRIAELIERHYQRSESVQAIFRQNRGPSNAYDIAGRITWSQKVAMVNWSQLSTWDKRLAMQQSVAHLEFLVFAHKLSRISQNDKIYYQTKS
jgi:glyoxylase-like metal-dependent hydrolase (beta-lactamase superfamily II)